MGTKKTTEEVKIPPPTPQELENQTLFNAILRSQLETQGFDVQTVRKKVQPGDPLYEDWVIKNKEAQKGKDGHSIPIPTYNDFDITETAGARERRLKREQSVDSLEKDLFAAVQKSVKGDYSVTGKQIADVNKIVQAANFGETYNDLDKNFKIVHDELMATFSSVETSVDKAIGSLIEAGKADIAESARQNRDQFKQFQAESQQGAELLGRSFSDTDFLRQTADYRSRLTEAEMGSQEQLYRGASANAASAIANLGQAKAGALGNLGQTRAMALGGIKEQEALARLGLLGQAANPIAAINSGSNFVQLQGALQAQGLANLGGTGALLQGELGRMSGDRRAQPTTTTIQPVSPLDILGKLVGMGASMGSMMGKAGG